MPVACQLSTDREKILARSHRRLCSKVIVVCSLSWTRKKAAILYDVCRPEWNVLLRFQVELYVIYQLGVSHISQREAGEEGADM